VRTQNATAASAIANIVKSSLGPVGLDKMLVDEVGDVTITNDGATILKQLDVEHPAAKVLVEVAQLQDEEVGDGTTSVVILAAELLKRANELVKSGLHPTSIMSGYRLALKEAVKFIKEKLCVPVDLVGRANLVNAANTTLSSKILGPEGEFFSNMAVDAVSAVRSTTRGEGGKKVVRYPVSAVHILKCQGLGALDSELVKGYALNCTRAAQGMPTRVPNAKLALLDFNLQKHRMQMGIEVVVEDMAEVDRIRQREMDITKERIEKILASGANVVLTTKGIDDLCMKYFVEAGAMAVRRVTKEDMRRIAKATGARIVTTLADMEGNETFDASVLGEAEEVAEERVGGWELIFVKGTKSQASCTIVLRGANDYMLDEMDRSLHDALMVVKRMLEGNVLVAGGGAVESALSIHLENYSTTLETREQLAIMEYAQALLVIPKTLAVNAAQDATELVAALRAKHIAWQLADSAASGSEGADGPVLDSTRYSGLDLLEGVVRDNLASGVVEPAMSKVKSLRFATEAAITILRIDDLIK
jgi:T-complex protein 1 subunit alpha